MENDSSCTPDVITALGYLCLGSRLKRLGERMQGGVAQVLAAHGHAVQPAQLPILMALHLDGAMTINALSERVGISQPGVSRAIAALAPLGMIETAPVGRDRRQRRIGLTPIARDMMGELERRFFPAVDQAVAALCGEASSDFLGELAHIEAGLAALPLEARVGQRMTEQTDG